VKEAGDDAVAAKRDGRTARAIGISSRIRGFPKRVTKKAKWAQRSSSTRAREHTQQPQRLTGTGAAESRREQCQVDALAVLAVVVVVVVVERRSVEKQPPAGLD